MCVIEDFLSLSFQLFIVLRLRSCLNNDYLCFKSLIILVILINFVFYNFKLSKKRHVIEIWEWQTPLLKIIKYLRRLGNLTCYHIWHVYIILAGVLTREIWSRICRLMSNYYFDCAHLHTNGDGIERFKTFFCLLFWCRIQYLEEVWNYIKMSYY